MPETARRLIGLVVGDPPAAWRAAGFDVADDRFVAGGVVIRCRDDEGAVGLRRWALHPPTSGPCDGLEAADPAEVVTPSTTAEHPNGVVAVDHVVVATDDVERTTAALAELGLTPRRTVVGARGDGDAEVAYRFFLLGTAVLELVGPAGPGDHGDGPPGARFAGLAFTSTRVEELGAIAGPPRDAVQPGRRIVTLRGRELGLGVPVALLSPRAERRTG